MTYPKISYLESNNKFLAPVDEIIEALTNHEGILFLSFEMLEQYVLANDELKFYVRNFDTHVVYVRGE